MNARTAVAVTSLAATAVAGLLGLQRVRRTVADRPGDPRGVLTADGVRLHVEESRPAVGTRSGAVGGPAEEPVTVVLVHGLSTSASVYEPLCAELSGAARLVRYDLRGHGRSGWSSPRRATVEQLGHDLGRVVDERGGPGPIVLVGHSLGGMAVLALLARRPELRRTKVAGVALLSTTARALDEGAALPWILRVLLRMHLGRPLAWALWALAPALEALHPFRRPAGRRLVRRSLFGEDPPADAVASLAGYWARTPMGVEWAFLAGLTSYADDAAVDSLRTVPVLVLDGREDATFPARDDRRLADRLGPTAELVLVPGAGHMVPLTHPRAVADALRSLLARVRAADGLRRTPCAAG